MKTKKFKSILLISILCLSISLSAFGCRDKQEIIGGNIELKMWGVFDNSSEINPFITQYKAQHPNVKITYEKKMFSEYENILLNDLAEGTGPDIFVMHNTWLPKYKNKISPATDDVITPQYFRETFVAVAEDDLMEGDKIYGLPLYIDTLAMYYNYDQYRNTRYGRPANTWNEFTDDIEQLNMIDPVTKISKRSAVALGTSNNVKQSVDILFNLFLQYGVDFYNPEYTKTTFASSLGAKALTHYLSYADITSPNYSWQTTKPDDIYEFVEGNVSTIIGYSYLYEQIAAQSRTKGLDFRVAKMPQIDSDNPVTYADYWAYTVKKMPKEDETKMKHAWNFLKMLSNKDSAETYHDLTKRPSAIRELIFDQEKESDFGVFAEQVRYAKSIKNYDRDKYNDIFETLIEEANLGNITPIQGLRDASTEINQILSAYQ